MVVEHATARAGDVEYARTTRFGKPLAQHFLPVGINPPRVVQGMAAPIGFEGRGFHWLDTGRAWVLFGGSVFDTGSGALLGSLNQPNVRSQFADPKGTTCQLVHADEFGGVHLFTHALDLEGARRAAVPNPAAPARDQGAR